MALYTCGMLNQIKSYSEKNIGGPIVPHVKNRDMKGKQ